MFDFDGIIIDSETPDYESHRRIFERCGVSLTTDEWCDQIGVWTEGHDERWFRELCARSSNAPDHARRTMPRNAADLRRGGAGRADARHSRAADRARRAQGFPLRSPRRRRRRGSCARPSGSACARMFGAIVTGRRRRAAQAGAGCLSRGGAPARRGPGAFDRDRRFRSGHRGGPAAGMTTIAIPHWLTERHDLVERRPAGRRMPAN